MEYLSRVYLGTSSTLRVSLVRSRNGEMGERICVAPQLASTSSRETLMHHAR